LKSYINLLPSFSKEILNINDRSEGPKRRREGIICQAQTKVAPSRMIERLLEAVVRAVCGPLTARRSCQRSWISPWSPIVSVWWGIFGRGRATGYPIETTARTYLGT
jgi:hypothetical protein